jgi:hypothetical protein
VADEWAVNTPKGQVRVSDLSLSESEAIEDACNAEWWNICAHPFRRAKYARVVYEAACRKVGAEPAELTLRDLPDTFVQVPDDLPDVFEGGLPKPEDAPATTGSSGAPSDSDGRPT